MARVLVVDDDDDVQAVLGQYLAHDGHDVVAARSGDQALGALDDPPDVMLLDLTLPDLDGLEVLRRLRSRRMDLPVLVLSARGEEADRLLGLGLGADDYVVKPFSPREICLRVAALLRRRASPLADRTSPAPYIFRWRSIEIRPTEHRVLADGNEVSVTPREFDLLLLFVRHPQQVFSRQSILAALWPEGYVSDHVVDVHLASLRRKLGETLHLESVRGVGFRLGGDA
ncbi:MAG: response regulator transcription factor [Thermaerobacter sp.]|nr:response regulator transcription factor [Thermaerobacter sp.]